MELAPELEKIRREAEHVNERIAAIFSSLTPEDVLWQPSQKSWSLAEILSHLEVTIHHVIPSVDDALKVGREKQLLSRGPAQLTAMGRFFLWYVEPPPKIKLPAPRVLRPIANKPANDLLAGFFKAQNSMLERIQQANGLDLNRIRFTSPFASFVKMDLLALFSVYTSHERRHLYQADNVVRQLRSRRSS